MVIYRHHYATEKLKSLPVGDIHFFLGHVTTYSIRIHLTALFSTVSHATQSHSFSSTVIGAF